MEFYWQGKYILTFSIILTSLNFILNAIPVLDIMCMLYSNKINSVQSVYNIKMFRMSRPLWLWNIIIFKVGAQLDECRFS